MEFSEIKSYKNDYADLLLLADEQTDMVEKYLQRGRHSACRYDLFQ